MSFTEEVNKSLNEIDRIPSGLLEEETKNQINKILGQWCYGSTGEKKNLLLLLSTLHEVWSKDEKLKEISLRELVEDASLASRTYRKIMVLFHDDKIKKYSIKEQWVARELYHIFTEAKSNFS